MLDDVTACKDAAKVRGGQIELMAIGYLLAFLCGIVFALVVGGVLLIIVAFKNITFGG